ncbi:MAG: efflux RND transporter periplasmic adaptor subunit [Candidatus Anammoximicrobium sp.]|nr:efflux RND transporter periplasmic adaptor subunit [Candidatus Anammoximicrobium sp.]
MKTLLKIFVVLLILGGIGAAAYWPAMAYWTQRNRPQWRTDQVVRGDILAVVNATGQVKPVLSVQVGAFVSGPIVELPVEFNQEVKANDLLAQIDKRIYQANVDQETAMLLIRQAEVKRVEALLEQARNDEKRGLALRARNENFLSDAERDQLMFNRMSLEAQLDVARASVRQAEASLKNAQANLDYTSITSPVDGIVIDRKIDPGQTLAAQFQTPQLFVVAPKMREKMHVHALIDEADIGLIREAQKRGLSVDFTVDAYPDDLFQGTIEEIRYSSTTTQNVVTYPVLVAAANPDLKLLPGMTASLSFRVDQRPQVLRIPNAALRFFPDAQFVREEDRKLLEGVSSDSDKEKPTEQLISANERAEARRRRTQRHVWVEDGESLKAVSVEVGLSDSRYTELITGDLQEDQTLVTGMKPK